ncbi:hypothetical protein [Streptomyces flaveolus]|uniref:hypothetical protein n=1 Tax=Streptomyces flaveolus TaxID=67297 RepID=UPI0016716A04|nr:hypothetical protein [Streptomyces flaveolus]GGQ48791.1 hypothetical protein GCM10010216_06880 [Streptomyces flaveolus]
MTGRRDVDEELRARLHEAAGAHEPDRARMLARVERGMAGRGHAGLRAARPPALGWARVAGATAAVAGVLAAGGYGVASAVKDDAPPQRSVATSPTSSPSAAGPTSPTAPAPRTSSVAPAPSTSAGTREPDRPSSSGTPAGTATATARPPAAGPEVGPLWSDGSVDPHSNDYWAQSNITLRTSSPLTALTVELRVAQTGGVASTGAWRSLPEDDFTFTVEERDGFLVHRWTLKRGRTVPAGEWMFAGQYNHERGGRDANGDRYSATAEAGGEQLSVQGGFAPHDGGS